MSIEQTIAKELRQEHAQFLEEIEVTNLSLPYIYAEDDDFKKSMSFVGKIIAHMDKEEKFFNIVLVVGNLEIKQVVRDLQGDHIQILSQFDIMKDTISKHGFSFTDEKIKDIFTSALKSSIELLIPHARKEDEKLFPYFENKQASLDRKDLGL